MSDPSPGMRINERNLLLARGLWFAIVVLALGLFLVAIPLRLVQLTTPTSTGDDALVVLSASEAELLAQRGISLQLYALYFIAAETIFAAIYIVLGATLYIRQPKERLAWVASIMLITFGVLVPATPRVLDTPDSPWQFPLHLIQNIGWISFATMFYLFPDGRFVPRLTRFVPIFFFAWAVAWLFYPLANPFNWPLALALLAFLGLALAGGIMQLYRYRFVSTPQQRLQTKWVVLAFGVATVGISVFVLPLLLFPETQKEGLARVAFHMLGIPIFSASLLLIPISLDIAIRRYRLWDIDPIFRRTSIYTTLTVTLLLIYFGIVFMLQQVLGLVTGQRQNTLVTVVSTLAIASLFVPLRNRIQDAIDKRFYRRKYNAQQVLNDFAETVRDETNLEALTTRLLEVVNETMQPKSLSLWLKQTRPDRKPRAKE